MYELLTHIASKRGKLFQQNERLQRFYEKSLKNKHWRKREVVKLLMELVSH